MGKPIANRDEWDSLSIALADDGFTEMEIFAHLGPRPLHRPAPARKPTNGNGDAHAASQRLVEALLPTGLEADTNARADAVRGSNGKPAPNARVGKLVTLSWGGKVERLAHAFVRLRGGSWQRLSPKQQEGFYSLADQCLKALELVEEDQAALARPPRKEMV